MPAGDRGARGARGAVAVAVSPASRRSWPSSTTRRRPPCARTSASTSPVSPRCGGAFALLDLIAFFTAGEDKPAHSWHLRRGTHRVACGRGDPQRHPAGFVRAEIIGWEALVDAGGYAGARDRGTLRIEGRDYVMADGEVMTVKFTP